MYYLSMSILLYINKMDSSLIHDVTILVCTLCPYCCILRATALSHLHGESKSDSKSESKGESKSETDSPCHNPCMYSVSILLYIKSDSAESLTWRELTARAGVELERSKQRIFLSREDCFVFCVSR